MCNVDYRYHNERCLKYGIYVRIKNTYGNLKPFSFWCALVSGAECFLSCHYKEWKTLIHGIFPCLDIN